MTPQRMCVSCRVMQDKSGMLRIVKQKDGGVKLDEGQKQDGRGAYICGKPECLNKMVKQRGLNRAFKREISGEIYIKVKEYFESRGREQQ